MKKILALIALSAFAMSAYAHGPSPQKVEKEVVIKAEPAKVWALVKDVGHLQNWLPLVTDTKLETKKDDSGNDATYRTLTLKDGGKVIEKIRSVDDGDMVLKYEIVEGTVPVADYTSKVTVKAGPGAGETTVTWMGRFYRVYKLNPPIPAGQDDESAVNAVNTIYDAGLSTLKKVAESK
jgi:uncharacterized protein YndB with AHSA1/START domain